MFRLCRCSDCLERDCHPGNIKLAFEVGGESSSLLNSIFSSCDSKSSTTEPDPPISQIGSISAFTSNCSGDLGDGVDPAPDLLLRVDIDSAISCPLSSSSERSGSLP